ncbi:hypothetical protein RB33_025 [Enterobacteria phage RB33]|uniref:Uncharacterized protein n=2 Tax=Enterobacteria phage RB32 TaxID=45406 RepID=A0A097J682_BPR32|nr:hypothetical protein RB32ORF024c [Escherichia phage RB32]ABI94848.1 unknown [Escherichia phage RB32]AIT74663.1 hypothetical protein RB33_025 [Enterobacteria phage RB33]
MKVLKKMFEWFNRPNSMYIDDAPTVVLGKTNESSEENV